MRWTEEKKVFIQKQYPMDVRLNGDLALFVQKGAIDWGAHPMNS